MKNLPAYAGPLDIIWFYCFRLICILVFCFWFCYFGHCATVIQCRALFTFTGMLAFQADAFSLRWYQDILNNPQWLHSIRNSFIIGSAATNTDILGTLAALGLSRPHMPYPKLLWQFWFRQWLYRYYYRGWDVFFYSKVGLSEPIWELFWRIRPWAHRLLWLPLRQRLLALIIA